jgi:glycosyltransferase involved in cell wall biosynthesis
VGFTFKREDVFDMGRMLRLLIADDLVRKAAGQASKQRIQEQYLWTKIAAEIAQAYLEMAGWENRDLLSPALAGHASKASASTREPVA